MRQVPQGQKSYTLIGSGRMAKHLSHYLKLKGFNIYNWSRSDEPEFNSLPITPDQTSEQRLEILADKTSHILLAINDNAIQEYADRYSHDHSVIHFSGSFYCENSMGLHPLMTFPEELYPDEFYETIPIVIDQPITLSDVLPGLNNPFYQIKPEQKSFYHCLCSMGGNFTQILLQKVINEFSDNFNIPASALDPYLNKVLYNSLNQPESLTGPLTRGDAETISKHKESLKEKPELELYQAFENYYKNTRLKK